jgi:hypothetical protein
MHDVTNAKGMGDEKRFLLFQDASLRPACLRASHDFMAQLKERENRQI